MHHDHDIPHSTNDSAVNTEVVVPNPHSTIPSSTNPHGTKHNASNKSAQKLKPSTRSQSQSTYCNSLGLHCLATQQIKSVVLSVFLLVP